MVQARRFAALTALLLGCSPQVGEPPIEGPREPESSVAGPASGDPAHHPSATAAPPQEPASSAAAAPATATARAEEPGDRIYAKARFVWIQRAPGGRGWVGYLTLGGSVRLWGGSRDRARAIGPGCKEWFRVEPDGYVCHGPETTLDPEDPAYVAIRAHRGREDDPFPYDYGESIGTPRFAALPSLDEQRREEWDFEQHQEKVRAARAKAEGTDPLYALLDLAPAGATAPDLPDFGGLVREARPRVIRGSTIAWSRAYDDATGRTWLYTSDHAWVPKDRVRPYPRSEFEGVWLRGGVQLPLAFARKAKRPLYRWDGATFVESDERVERLAWVPVSDERKVHGGLAYVELAKGGVWLREVDFSVARASSTPPYLEAELAPRETEPDAAGRSEPPRRTWIDVSVFGGTLVAYEGRTPVFATLISPGRGGTPIPGRDPVSTASTPTGAFRVDGKFRWATMVSSSDSNIVHSEVQYVQNFHGPHALHGAYWHDAFGELKSGGCVNLSPKDSKTLFEWTDPPLPKDWHGVRSTSDRVAPTRIVIRD